MLVLAVRIISSVIILGWILISCSTLIKAQEKTEYERVALSYLGYNAFQNLPDSTVASDVDSILFNCLDTSEATTMGQIDCYFKLMGITEKMILYECKELSLKLDHDDKKLFKETQYLWNKYFNQEKNFLHKVFYTWTNQVKYGHGSEHSIAQAEWLFQIARQRLIALRVFSKEINN